MKKIYGLLITFTILLSITELNAHSGGMVMTADKVMALGITGDYGYNGNYHDGGIYLSSKIGFVSIVSALVSGDIGYRFNEEMIHGDLGVEGYFLFAGVRLDFAYGIKPADGTFYPGIGYYLTFGIIVDEFLPVLFVGARTLVDYGTELRVGMTLLYNFAD